MCEACMKGKQTRDSFKPKFEISTKKILELIHMDLIGPTRHLSLGGKSYILVIVDIFLDLLGLDSLLLKMMLLMSLLSGVNLLKMKRVQS